MMELYNDQLIDLMDLDAVITSRKKHVCSLSELVHVRCCNIMLNAFRRATITSTLHRLLKCGP